MAESIRFYLDEHVAGAVARGLRQRRIDVLTAAEAGMLGASDEEQIELAGRTSRVLVSFDADFLRLHASGAAHAGIAWGCRPLSVGKIVEARMLIHSVYSAKEMNGKVEFF